MYMYIGKRICVFFAKEVRHFGTRHLTLKIGCSVLPEAQADGLYKLQLQLILKQVWSGVASFCNPRVASSGRTKSLGDSDWDGSLFCHSPLHLEYLNDPFLP